MYPSDDRLIRIRLLINECREVRLRLEASVAESRALRVRATGLIQRAQDAIVTSHGSRGSRGKGR